MPREQRSLTPADILSPERYEQVRAERKREGIARKKLTRLAVGPHATAMFETWDSMWLQVHEMLRIEKGGEGQVADELAAYDPMVPKGRELTLTLFFEVGDTARREAFLRTIGGVEGHVALRIGDRTIRARAEGDIPRTRERDNKASAVHFFHFDFDETALGAWRDGSVSAMLVIDHPNYGHAALIGPETRAFLTAACFD